MSKKTKKHIQDGRETLKVNKEKIISRESNNK